MNTLKKDSINTPLFSCCYQQSLSGKTPHQFNLPSKILYQTRTTDPKSDCKDAKDIKDIKDIQNNKHNSSLNIIYPSLDSPTNFKSTLKNNDKLSIRNKKTKQPIKNQIKSPQNNPTNNDKKISKESNHYTKTTENNFKKDQNSNEDLASYDSNHIKYFQQQNQKNIKNQKTNDNSPNKGPWFVNIKTQKKSCVIASPQNILTFKSPQNKKKISINTQKINQNNNQIQLFSSGNQKNERKISQNLSKITILSPSHNTSMIYQQKNEQIKSPINSIQMQANNFNSPKNINLNTYQVHSPKILSIPQVSENKKNFFYSFFSENKNLQENHLKTIQQNIGETKQCPIQIVSPNNQMISTPTLIQSKIQRKNLDVNNPQSNSNLLSIPSCEKKRDHLKLPRKSDLQMLKASCISEIDGNNEQPVIEEETSNYVIKVQVVKGSNLQSEKQKSSNPSVKSSFNTNKSLLSRLGASKMTSNQLKLAGLGSMTVNSFAESVSQSKINTKIDQSVVMLDFFNPSKILFNKWSKKEKVHYNNDQSAIED